MQFVGRGDVITALFYPHNFLQDEKIDPIHMSEGDDVSKRGRPTLCPLTRTLPAEWQATDASPSRSGETPMRATIRIALEAKSQRRPEYNIGQSS